MLIRPATPGDFDAVQRVFRNASLSNTGDRANLLSHPEFLVFSPDALAEGRTLVATGPDGAVVGFATATPSGIGLELDDLFVDPAWMRKGVGRRLIESVVELARAGGADRVVVTANPHAMAFYESAGFVPDGSMPTQFGPAPRLRLDVPGSPARPGGQP